MPLRNIGPVIAKPGTLVTGNLEGIPLPTGQTDDFPLVVLNGHDDGPVLWLTATVHGNELTGYHVIQQLLRSKAVQGLRGAIAALPLMNPTGFRQRQRLTNYGLNDPNRLFPSTRFQRKSDLEFTLHQEHDAGPTVVEMRFERLFNLMAESASCVLDLHCALEQSVPFLFRDRVIYRNERDFDERKDLDETLQSLVDAIGLPVLNELPAHRYIEKKLHRSLSGSVLNEAGIPAATLELGPKEIYHQEMIDIGVGAVLNLMRFLGMIDGRPTRLETATPPANAPTLRQFEGPRSHLSGILRYHVRPGDWVPAGQPLATVHDVFGEQFSNGAITFDQDCFVAGLYTGCIAYPREPIALVGIADEYPTLAQHPEYRR